MVSKYALCLEYARVSNIPRSQNALNMREYALE